MAKVRTNSDDTLRRAFWQRIGRTPYTTTDAWETERGAWCDVATMPMRQLVNTLRYVERHAGHVLGIQRGEATPAEQRLIQKAAARWCPIYAEMQLEARGRKHPTAPGAPRADMVKLAKLHANVAAIRGRWAQRRQP